MIGWSLRAPPDRAPSFALTAGEEIGWCEYMLTRLVDEGVPRSILAGGVIRGLWHMPVVLAGGYAAGPSVVLSAVFTMVSINSFGYVIATGWRRTAPGQ